MYAVIRTGGKQYRVAPGDKIRVERLGQTEATLTPLLVVDGESVTSEAGALADLPVVVKVVEEGRGKKIVAGKYKNKTRYRRRWGHRQDFSLIEISSIGGVEAQVAPVADAPEAPEAKQPAPEADEAAPDPVEAAVDDDGVAEEEETEA
jgi:large subunit ribosomal protein L21